MDFDLRFPPIRQLVDSWGVHSSARALDTRSNHRKGSDAVENPGLAFGTSKIEFGVCDLPPEENSLPGVEIRRLEIRIRRHPSASVGIRRSPSASSVGIVNWNPSNDPLV